MMYFGGKARCAKEIAKRNKSARVFRQLGRNPNRKIIYLQKMA